MYRVYSASLRGLEITSAGRTSEYQLAPSPLAVIRDMVSSALFMLFVSQSVGLHDERGRGCLPACRPVSTRAPSQARKKGKKKKNF